jgi:aldose 1-epimerase
MRLITLTTDGARATVAPDAGGRLLQLEVRDGEARSPMLLVPADPSALIDDPLAWGCYPMVPWPGRVAQARFIWDGRTYALAANDGPHAIHGLGVWTAWQIEHATTTACRLALDLTGRWPFPARAIHELRLAPDALTLRLELHATGGVAVPAGLGWHPWFRRDPVAGEAPCLRLDAAETYETTPDLIPTGRLLPVDGDADLRAGPALGDRRLDSCYRDVRLPITVRWGVIDLTIGGSPNLAHAVVYTPQRGFCVEPQTCAPDAFNLAARGVKGAGLAVARPGEPLVAESTWRWRRT